MESHEGDHRKAPEKGGGSDMLTWAPLVAYMVVALLVALLFSLATVKLLKRRRSRTRTVSLSKGRTSPPKQRATLTLRNGNKSVPATEMSNIVLIANQKEEITKF